MFRRVWFTLAILLTVTAGTLREAASQELDQGRKAVARTQSHHDQLRTGVDLWHDAWLKGDRSKIEQYRQEIFLTLLEDIKLSSQEVSRYANAHRQSSLKSRRGQREDPKDKMEMAAKEAELNRVKEMVQIKTRLLQALNATESFGTQYRLLGDYLGLLRKQLSASRLELANVAPKAQSPTGSTK